MSIMFLSLLFDYINIITFKEDKINFSFSLFSCFKKEKKESQKGKMEGNARQKGQKASAFCSLLSFAFAPVSVLDVR